MDLEAVKQLFNPYLEEHKLSLEEIGFVKESGYLILRLTVDRPGGIDLDTLAACNEFLSAELEKIDGDMPEYMLEVSSPGAEKPLKSLGEVCRHVHDYIHIELENAIYEGTLEKVENDSLEVRYNAKGQFRKILIPYDQIKLIRLAVKI